MDSLKKRYTYKLLTNLVGLAVNCATQSIIPRGLGPKAYGDFSFLSGFFADSLHFLSLGTYVGFYTVLSQRQRDISLAVYYLYFSVVISVVVLCCIPIVHVSGLYPYIWPDQIPVVIYLAAGLGVIAWINQVSNGITDAYGLTVDAEQMKIGQKVAGLVLFAGLFAVGQLNLFNYFYASYILGLIGILVFLRIAHQYGYALVSHWRLTFHQVTRYSRELYHLCHPLFIFSFVGMCVGVFDRWLLQVYGGSIQQGMFGLANQLSAICFIFVSSLTPLLTREFSISFAKNDLQHMSHMFQRYVPVLYSVVAYFSCFLAVQAGTIIYLFGGGSYNAALTPVTIMSLYPLYQTYGQLSGSVLYATGQTRLYRNIGILFMLLGLPLTYILIAPYANNGLDAGATGIAIKTVVIAGIAVNVQLYFNARLLKFSFARLLFHQFMSVLCLLGCAVFARQTADQWFRLLYKPLWSIGVAGVVYSVMVLCLACSIPTLFGLSRNDIVGAFERIRGL